MAEQDDLPPGPCTDGVTLVRVARCVEGVWQLGWIESGALAEGNPLRVAPKPCGGSTPTNVYDTISHAVRAVKQGWECKDVIELVGKLCELAKSK